jgi:hypothetical protein
VNICEGTIQPGIQLGIRTSHAAAALLGDRELAGYGIQGAIEGFYTMEPGFLALDGELKLDGFSWLKMSMDYKM